MKKLNNYFDAKSREDVLAALRSANVAKVELVVSGGGDEGGDGMITLDVKTGTVAINIDVNEIRSENVVDIKDAPWSTV